MKKWIGMPTALALCAPLLLLIGVSDLWAQAAQAPGAWLNRPLLTAPFFNVGIQDRFYGQATSGTALQYPRWSGGTYGDLRLRDTASSNWEAYAWVDRTSHGVWTLTSDARVNYTGVRVDGQDRDITPMQYDISADPDLSKLGRQYYQHRRPTVKMGYGVVSAGVVETGLGGNWWPGSPLIEEGKKTQPYARPPVKVLNWNFSAYQTDDTWAEDIILTKWTNKQGLTITERASGWSHPDFDDFYLDEYVIENTGDTNGDGKPDLSPVPAQNSLFFGVMDRFNNSGAGQQFARRYWSNDEDWAMDDWYKYDPSLKLLYEYDGDHPLYNSWDDTGDPYYDAFAHGTVTNGGKIYQTEGQILSFAHVGVGVLAYTDKGASNLFNTRDRNQGYVAPEGDQPYAIRFWEAFNPNAQNDPNLSRMSAAKVYSEVVGTGRRIDPNPDHPSGQFSMLVFGPYNLPPGGKAKIVLAYVAGQPGQALGNVDPMTWARSSSPIDKKQAELPKGLDALKQNLSAARFAYDNAFDLPDAPPDVNFRTGSSAFARMKVDWPDEVEKAAHPDYAGTEASDIAGYRVYRSTWYDVGPWELLADIPKGTSRKTSAYEVTYSNNLYTFEDLQSAAGFFYHYSVRAYAKGHKTWSAGNANSPLDMAKLPSHISANVQKGLEGGWAAPTQRIYADESPFQPPVVDTESLTRRVLVVPNPYIADDQHAYPGSTKIRFVGIPSKARIRVYSMSGELVADVAHNDATKGERDFDQSTWVYNGEIATGVYFFVVQNLIEGPNFGKRQRGTFMVIR